MGNNNSGKSTLIEGLKVIKYVVDRLSRARFVEVPQELRYKNESKGIKIDTNFLEIDLGTVVTLYKDNTIATIKVVFDTGCKIIANLSINGAYAFLEDEQDVHCSQ